jgi:hypothetical protein
VKGAKVDYRERAQSEVLMNSIVAFTILFSLTLAACKKESSQNEGRLAQPVQHNMERTSTEYDLSGDETHISSAAAQVKEGLIRTIVIAKWAIDRVWGSSGEQENKKAANSVHLKIQNCLV